MSNLWYGCSILYVCSLYAQPNHLTPEEKAAGWQLMFDGNSLRGWTMGDASAVNDGWIVVDGAITTIPPTRLRSDW